MNKSNSRCIILIRLGYCSGIFHNRRCHFTFFRFSRIVFISFHYIATMVFTVLSEKKNRTFFLRFAFIKFSHRENSTGNEYRFVFGKYCCVFPLGHRWMCNTTYPISTIHLSMWKCVYVRFTD